MSLSEETHHHEYDLILTERERQENIALYQFLVRFIYNLGHLDLTQEQTRQVTAQAVDHFMNRNDDPERLHTRLETIADAIMFNNPSPDHSVERQVRRLVVVGYLIGRDYRTLTTEDLISDVSDAYDYDSDATTDQKELDLNQDDDDATHKQGGGKRIRKLKSILPQLKPVTMKNKKYTYKLNDPPSLRHKAIDEGIRYENKYMNKTKKQAAISKKGRFNILRIYRRNNNLKECKILTKDMEYMDKKYKLGKTSKICKNKNRTRKSKKSKKTTKKKRVKKSRQKR